MWDLLQEQDFLCRLDLKDAYLMVPICLYHRRFLRFRWEDQVYQFTCLPFGLSTAPRTFTKVLKPVVTAMHARGTRLVVYLDDFLLMNQSSQHLKQECQALLDLLEGVGFLVNYPKSDLLPSKCMTFLGFNIDSRDMTIRLPHEKVAAALAKCNHSSKYPGCLDTDWPTS